MAGKLVVLIFMVLFGFDSLYSQKKTVNISTCLNGRDATPAVYEALKECKNTNAGKLVFPEGKYEFWPDYAIGKFIFVSNNSEGLKRFVFDLSGMSDFEIDGQGSEFIFHGFICPFFMDGSSDIHLKNFSIDYSRTFHSEGTIKAVYKDSADISFSQAFPYRVNNCKLTFWDDKNIEYPWANLLEYDTQKKETAFMADDFWCGSDPSVKELSRGNIRLYLNGIKGTVGNTFVFGAGHRITSAFTISKSNGITLSNVNIYHCGGMGVIAQLSRNLTLNNVNVIPAPNSGRILSASADATHFVNCGGKITMVNCVFENQNDDATNIHGMYAHIDKILSPTNVMVKYIYGFDFLAADTDVEFVDPSSYVTYDENIVKTVERLNNQYSNISFSKPLSAGAKIGDAIASTKEYPDVLIRNCKIGNNRARGILLGSRGKIVVEDCVFHTPGTAILLEGDARTGSEQAGVRDLTIRHNTFDNCNFSVGPWGTAAIQVRAGINESKREISRYNRNILIEDNLFKVFTPRILNMYSVDGLKYRNNRIENTSDYKMEDTNPEPFVVLYSSNVEIEK